MMFIAHTMSAFQRPSKMPRRDAYQKTSVPCNYYWATQSWKALCGTLALKLKMLWNCPSRRKFEWATPTGDQHQFWVPATGRSSMSADGPDRLIQISDCTFPSPAPRCLCSNRFHPSRTPQPRPRHFQMRQIHPQLKFKLVVARLHVVAKLVKRLVVGALFQVRQLVHGDHF